MSLHLINPRDTPCLLKESHPAGEGIGAPSENGFTLIELLVVMGIIAILGAIAVPLVPSLLRSNTMNSNVATLSGILEVARETAISANTYMWVAFTDPPVATPVTGTWVAVIQSKDGTEAPSPTIPSPWVNLTIPGGTSNLQLFSKLQNLPGVELIVNPVTITNAPITLQNLNLKVTNAATSKTPAGAVPPAYPSSADTPATTSFPTGVSVQWTITPLQSSTGANIIYFTHIIEFTPDGEAHVEPETQAGQTSPTWYSDIQFGMIPSIGTSTSNAVLFNVERLTGKATAYRP